VSRGIYRMIKVTDGDCVMLASQTSSGMTLLVKSRRTISNVRSSPRQYVGDVCAECSRRNRSVTGVIRMKPETMPSIGEAGLEVGSHFSHPRRKDHLKCRVRTESRKEMRNFTI
jgi:hypothetical protein